MSIVALKRKTQAQYNNMSVGQPNFSLNGTHRSQGFVGQTSLSRSLQRSSMKGATLRGHGGCCGKYFIGGVIQSAVTSTENPNIIKSSVVNTNTILTQKHNLTRQGPNSLSVVKPDTNQKINSQGVYIDTLSNQMTNCPLVSNGANIANKMSLSVTNNSCYTKPAYKRAFSLYYKPRNTYTNIPVNGYMSESNYILNKNNICTNNNIFTVQKSIKGEPLVGGN